VTVDPDRLMAEIEDEVRRKRASGELPADLERELDLVFARFAPVNAIDGDFHRVLARVEESTFIDVLAPTESSRPVVPYFKRVVAKAVRWQIRYVAQQVTGVASALARALRLLGERVDRLEMAVPPADVLPRQEAATMAGPWHDLTLDTLRGLTGRVLHADAGSGNLVADLVASGLDAYGVEPSDDVALAAASRGLDVRADDVLSHLELLPDGSLAGAVLSGCVDSLPVGAQLRVVELLADKLAIGGRVVIIATSPSAWHRTHSPVEVDLAPGRPLHAETWEAVLTRYGLRDVHVEQGAADDGLERLPGDDASTNKANANVDRLNRLLFGPSTFAITATRR
jgi:hypothetical protein